MSDAPHSYALGRVALNFSGTGPLLDAILAEMQFQSTDVAQCRSQIEFIAADSLPEVTGVDIGDYTIGDNVIRVHDRFIPHVIQLDGTTTTVTFAVDAKPYSYPFVAGAVRFADASYNNTWMRLSKRFFYDIFDQAVQIHQLADGQTWCHSSAFRAGDRTVMLMAWGGVGKTSGLIKFLYADEGWKFLSDDLAVLDEDGTVYRTPQRMQIYPYNLEGEKELESKLLAGRKPADKGMWHARARILGKKKVRRRVHAEKLFGDDSVAVSGHATDAIFLRRTSDAAFSFTPLPASEIADLNANVLQQELTPLDVLYAAISSSDPHPSVGRGPANQNEATAKVKSIVEKATADVTGVRGVLSVPRGSSPQALKDEITRVLRGAA